MRCSTRPKRARARPGRAPSRPSSARSTILLREGLEALLIVVAMLAFLHKGDRPDMLRPVHYGWVERARRRRRHLVGSDQPDHHQRRDARADRRLRLAARRRWSCCSSASGCTARARPTSGSATSARSMDHALASGSAWFLFSLAFIAVYREVFETILFFAALCRRRRARQRWSRARVAGAVACWRSSRSPMLRFSQRLPIGKFFTYSSALIAVLAVVLAGKGVGRAAGGRPDRRRRRSPACRESRMLGIFPTREVIAAQIASSLAACSSASAWNRWRRAAPKPARLRTGRARARAGLSLCV